MRVDTGEHPVADGDSLDPIAESNHFAGKLVAKHEWTLRLLDGA
jgi:hypothetical protein